MMAVTFKVDGSEQPTVFTLSRAEDAPAVEPRLLYVEQPETGWPTLEEEELESRLAVIRDSVTLEALREEPDVAAYRQFYWRLGIDPTKRRPSAEALNRRIIAGKPFPRINPVVDRYNLVSAEHRVSIGGFNVPALEALTTSREVTLRMAVEGEEFLGIGFPEPKPLTGKEVVLSADGFPFALYPYRDSHETRIRGDDPACLFTFCAVPGLEESRIEAAVAALTSEFDA